MLSLHAHNSNLSLCALYSTAMCALILIKFDSQSSLLYSVPELDHNPIM
jgi:hypothetical protein